MSKELVCPFCQQELKYESEVYVCRNPNCKHLLGFGTKELWQELTDSMKEHDLCHDALVERTKELDRTRKVLGFALDWLREVATPEKCDDDLCREFTKRKLAEIKTVLEQKDK